MVFAWSLCSDSSRGIMLGRCCWHYEYHILLLFGQSVTNRIADKIVSRMAANYEPQATAVELAQLGEGDSPQCGEMSRRDKGAGHPLNRGQAAPCKEWTMSMNKNLRKTRKNAVRHLKNKKTSSKLYSKKDSSAIRTTHPPANSTQADSEAILPNRTQMVFLRAFPVVTVPLEQLQDTCLLFRFHKAGRSCSPRLEKLSLFSPPPPCAKSMAQGFRCLRAAIRATRPEPRQHF